MDNQKEMIRLLDDFDTTLSIDSRAQGDRITSSIDLEVQPIVLRVSYRDVLLVQRVVQKAIDLSNKPDLQGSDSSLSMDRTQNAPAPEADSVAPVTAAPSQTGTKDVQAGTLQLMMSRQRVSFLFGHA